MAKRHPRLVRFGDEVDTDEEDVELEEVSPDEDQGDEADQVEPWDSGKILPPRLARALALYRERFPEDPDEEMTTP